jgi:AraC-like DNA-binding protein
MAGRIIRTKLEATATGDQPAAKHNRIEDDLYVLMTPLRRGALSLEVNGFELFKGIARPGMLRLIAPGEKWNVQVFESFPLLQLQIPGPVWRRLLNRIAGALGPGKLTYIDPLLRPLLDVERLARVLVTAPEMQSIHEEMLSEGVTLSLLSYLLENHAGNHTFLAKGGLTKKQLISAVEFAQSRFNEGLSVRAWAKELHMAPHEFTRRFRMSTGATPYRWFLETRIDSAKVLLSTTNLRVADIAQQTGFSNQSHFTAAFRSQIGISPLEWRAHNRTGT